MEILKMRLPTCAEYSLLVEATSDDDNIILWKNMCFWCWDTCPDCASHRAVRGYRSAHFWYDDAAAARHAHIGFRPAFEIQNPDALGSNKVVTVGTLYMDGRPVRVPEKPVLNGDIWSYVPGSKLELRPALDDPAYQVRAIKAGNTLIADRTLLKYASWNDIQMALDNEGRSYLVLNWKNFIFQKSPKS